MFLEEIKQMSAPDISFSYAPGKIILVGEHAVVYGAKALAMPIDVGVRVAISRLGHHHKGAVFRGIGSFLMKDISLDNISSSSCPNTLKNALLYLNRNFAQHIKDLLFVIDGNLPFGRGLGASAALSVAMIRALFRYFSWPLHDETLKMHVKALETIFHGTPSGIDHTVIMLEQALSFKKEYGQEIVSPILLHSPLTFILVMAGPHDGTKQAVLHLAERKKRHESIYNHIFSGLNNIADEIEKLISLGHLSAIGELMNVAQGYLNALSLSTPEIEKLCHIVREQGALGAKLTGAGGGGAVIALVDHNELGIKSALKAAGYQSMIVNVGKEKYDQ